jgi:hypothetical protein
MSKDRDAVRGGDIGLPARGVAAGTSAVGIREGARPGPLNVKWGVSVASATTYTVRRRPVHPGRVGTK